jgi:hypothetical protein
MGRDKRKGKEPVVEPSKKKKTRSQKEAERAAMATRAPLTIRPLVEDVRSRFVSLEPGRRSSRVSESVRLPVGRFVSIRGLKEGTLSVRFRVRDSQRPGPIALAPLHSAPGLDQGEGSQGQEAQVGSSDGGVAAVAQRYDR